MHGENVDDLAPGRGPSGATFAIRPAGGYHTRVFDEGDKPTDWSASLECHGITVRRDVLRADAVAVLEAYRRGGGVIY